MSNSQFIGFYNTPPLWVHEQFGMVQFPFPKIEFEGLETQPISTKMRLGHQMESVFLQLINYSKKFKVRLHNHPVLREKRTIGEIDFILEDLQSHRLIHVELTYKFYIIDPSISEPIHQLMGPNRRDMFFTKMEKIKNQQFQLVHEPEAITALKNNGIESNELVHQCCFKAQLFVPYWNPTVHIRPLNKTCIAGFWISFDEFNATEFKEHQYYIPYKSQWVIDPHKNVDWLTHYECLLEINIRIIKENSPMLWMKKQNGGFTKMFVVWW